MDVSLAVKKENNVKPDQMASEIHNVYHSGLQYVECYR